MKVKKRYLQDRIFFKIPRYHLTPTRRPLGEEELLERHSIYVDRYYSNILRDRYWYDNSRLIRWHTRYGIRDILQEFEKSDNLFDSESG